jgi:hypothetical protein
VQSDIRASAAHRFGRALLSWARGRRIAFIALPIAAIALALLLPPDVSLDLSTPSIAGHCRSIADGARKILQ